MVPRCRLPVQNLYTTYSKADDKALGKGVRLTQCPRCKKFADKYVEHDLVVLFIDLVLIKPQVCPRPRLLSISNLLSRLQMTSLRNIYAILHLMLRLRRYTGIYCSIVLAVKMRNSM
jgi:hypothetical protein